MELCTCSPGLQVKGVADAGAASLRVSGLELGGLFGSLLAGKLSDMLINNSKGGGGNVGKRVQVGAPAHWAAFGRACGVLVPPLLRHHQSRCRGEAVHFCMVAGWGTK